MTAGATTAFDKADLLRNYFTDPVNGFTYSLTVPTGNSGDPLVDFLTIKQGFCEQYASAMAIMLRAVGVPARVAVGFTQGTKDAGRRLRHQQQRRARLGGGAVRQGRLGAVRPDAARRRPGRTAGFHRHRPRDTHAPVHPAALPPRSPMATEVIPTGRAARAAPTQARPPRPCAAAGGSPDLTRLWWSLVVLVVAGRRQRPGPTVVRNRRRRVRLGQADAGGPGGRGGRMAGDRGPGGRPRHQAESRRFGPGDREPVGEGGAPVRAGSGRTPRGRHVGRAGLVRRR